jgi:acyl-CoA synthetase (AMP-forming)/AMP-acid ligase II
MFPDVPTASPPANDEKADPAPTTGEKPQRAVVASNGLTVPDDVRAIAATLLLTLANVTPNESHASVVSVPPDLVKTFVVLWIEANGEFAAVAVTEVKDWLLSKVVEASKPWAVVLKLLSLLMVAESVFQRRPNE